MPKKPEGYLTQAEKKNPLGKMVNALSSDQVVDKLKDLDFLTEELKLTRRGKEYVEAHLNSMDSVQRIMIERFILEHHQVTLPVSYEDARD